MSGTMHAPYKVLSILLDLLHFLWVGQWGPQAA